MADEIVVAASVQPGTTGAEFEVGIAGATLTAGQAVYLDSSDNKYKLCDADASALTGTFRGITMGGGAAGQKVLIQRKGSYTAGFTVVVGTIYLTSDTPGGIRAAVDVDSGDWLSIIGVGKTAALLDIIGYNSGIQVP